jgi:hypothetical protein
MDLEMVVVCESHDRRGMDLEWWVFVGIKVEGV